MLQLQEDHMLSIQIMLHHQYFLLVDKNQRKNHLYSILQQYSPG